MTILAAATPPRKRRRIRATGGLVLLLGACLAGSVRADPPPSYADADAFRTILTESVLRGTVPDVAVDYLENSHVVWKNGRELYYAKMSKGGAMLAKDAGGAIVPAVLLDTVNTATFLPTIAADYDGAAHIAVADGAMIRYYKIGPDGSVALRKAVTAGPSILVNAQYAGADIAIDPKTNLPVIATLLYTDKAKLIGGYPFREYKESIRVLRLDAAGAVTTKELHAWAGPTLGGPPGMMEPPVVAVDAEGISHVVWKAREANTVEGPSGKNLPGEKTNVQGIGWKKGDLMLQYSNSEKAKSAIVNARALRINIPGDIQPGFYLPQPRIAVDDNDRVHVVWLGRDPWEPNKGCQIRYSRIKWDGYGTGKAGTAYQYGTVENRSVVVSGPDAEVERVNPDLAVGDGVLHVVWSDGRDNEDDTEDGCRVYHGAVTLATGVVQPAGEYAVSELLDADAAAPRISLRPEKEFLAWTGYDDPTDTNFEPDEPDTVVNLREQDINVTATFKPWPAKPCPPDPTITLAGGAPGASVEVPISADDGFGGYSIVWQAETGDHFEIALHRRQYWAGVYGLWTPYKRVTRAWDKDDRDAAGSEANRTSGTMIDVPVRVTDTYRELIRYSNYHEAQGMVADGVTPLIIRMDLPAGKYYVDLDGDTDSDNLASYINLNKLHVYNHLNQAFEPCPVTGPQVTSTVGPDGINTLETIFYVEGFDFTDPVVPWPVDDKVMTANIQLKLWKKPVNGEGLDMTDDGDPPFAVVPFSVTKPPVVLVHGFNASAETWSTEFKQVLEKRREPGFVKAVAYGQEKVPVGMLADFIGTFAKDNPGAYTDLEVLYGQYSTTKGWLDAVKSKLTDLGVLPEDDQPDILGTFLSAVKSATYWQKSANASADLRTLERMLTLKLYTIEEKFRREDRWAFTRYDVVGHGQGGVLVRMLCSNEDIGRAMTFLHERNCDRGRFRRIVTIGAPHRGSRLTAYWRLYKDVALEQARQLANDDPTALLEPLPLLGAAASLVGAALPYYAERAGYLEPKFDPFIGEIVEINQDLPVHPKAKFHLISTVVNHDSLGVWPIFQQLGLEKDAPNGLFEFTLPPPAVGHAYRFSDGLVDWRSHFGGVDYVSGAADGMITNLDEWGVAGDSVVKRGDADPVPDTGWVSHVPPFPVTAIIGEPPGPMTLNDLWDLAKNVGTGDWKALLLQATTGLVQKILKDKNVQVPVFGTYFCQTNSKVAALRIRDLLDGPVGTGAAATFGTFYNYAAGLGNTDGNPEGDDPLSTQEAALKQKIRDSVRILPNPRENNIIVPAARRGDVPATDTFVYELVPPAAFPIAGGAAPEWSASVINGLQGSDLGVTLTPDATDPMIVHVSVDPLTHGQVYLHCTYLGADGRTVIIDPFLIGAYNMGEVVAIYPSAFTPVLAKGASIQLGLEAEYSSGAVAPLYPTVDEPVTWATSDPAILTVDAFGIATSVGPLGTAVITATFGSLFTDIEITVAGHGPEVHLTSPTGFETLTGGDSLVLEAVADDPDGAVASVSFFANDLLVGGGEDTTAPYSVTWTQLPVGDYEVYAIAVDDDGILSTSESRFIQIANRPPTLDSWAAPGADQWYSGTVHCAVTASDPDGDAVTVRFEYSLDSTDGTNGTWSECWFPITAPPYECEWQSFPLEAVDDAVWLRVTATDVWGDSSAPLTRMIKIDNSTPGLTFNPHPDDVDIPLTVHPTITFDSPVTLPGGGEITDANVAGLVTFTSGGLPVPATVTIDAGKTIVTVTPAALLAGVTRYTVSIVGDFQDSVSGDVHPHTSAAFSTTFGAPAALAFLETPTGGEAGAVFDRPVRVAIVDAQGNTVRNSSAAVTVSLVSGARAATLSGTTAIAATDGIAEFADLSMTVAGAFGLRASSTGLTSADSAEFAIRPSALARIAVALGQATAPAGTAVDVTVSVYDRFDNLKTDYISTPNFTTSDTRAVLPHPYTFYETDAGSHLYRLAFTPGTRGDQWVKAHSGAIESPAATVTVTNAPPAAPIAKTPTGGVWSGLTPNLRTETYVDPDETTHAATRWQVAADAAFSSVIWDSGEGAAATSITIPAGVLAQNTTYWWRARFKDNSGDAATEWGPWSTPAAFRTAYAFPFTDDFSTDRGWQGLAPGQWMIGPATPGGGAYGFPDPAEDTSPTDDNGILGYNIGGDYPPDADAAAVSPPIDCSTADIVELSFQRRLGVEKNDWARAAIDVSSDGLTWNTVWANSGDDLTDDQWVRLTYDITPYAAGRPTVFIRFAMGPMRMAYPYCGWNIDDLEVRAGAPDIVSVALSCPETNVKVGDTFHVEVYVSENSPDVSGVLGGAFDFDLPQTLAHYYGPYYTRDCMVAPFTEMKTGARYTERIDQLGGLSTETGHGNGTPVLFASIPFKADKAGTARFVMRPAGGGVALPQPVGVVSEWRIPEVTLDVPIAPAPIVPLAIVTLEGPAESVPLGNEFEVRVYVKETAANAAGVLGGVLDLYFDPALTALPAFDPATAIQPPYAAAGFTSGTLLASRIDELGGLTTETGHGNGTPVLFARLVFRADALGQADFEARPGSTGLTLTSPVGQLDFSLIDYGPPLTVTIEPNYHLILTHAAVQAGNGNYVEGAVVPIQADAPDTGKTFDHWEGDTADLATVAPQDQPTANVTMPAADVALTAVFRNILYTLTVNGGTGDTDQAIYQQQIAIHADPPTTGKVFDHWEGDTDALGAGQAGSEDATVTMPAADVTLTAIYRNLFYTLTVNNGTGGKADAIYAERINISADPAPTGYRFSHWTGNIEVLSGNINPPANDPTPTVTMPAANVVLTAVYENVLYTLTVNNGTGDTDSAVYQQQIAIAADAPPVGKAFDRWTGDTGALGPGQETSPTATVTMPAAHVALTATYRDILYTLTVVEGSGSGRYSMGTVVNVSAAPRPNGADFIEWKYDVAGLADKTQQTTTFTMPAADAVIAPKFVGDDGCIGLYCLIVLGGAGSGRYAPGESVTITATVPDGSTFVQWGGMTDAFADNVDQAAVTFDMPAADTAVRAVMNDPVLVDVRPGWNLISVDRPTLNPAGLIEYQNVVLGSVWSWGNGGFFSVDAPTPPWDRDGLVPAWHRQGLLLPDHGYWLYAAQPHTLVLP